MTEYGELVKTEFYRGGITEINTKKLALAAFLTCLASAVFAAELHMPQFVPVPGAKLGLANTVTLFVLCLGKDWTGKDAALILTARILLGALITGQPSALMFSLTGGISALSVMLLIRKAADGRFEIPAPFLSIAGAVFHNIAQILTASAAMGSVSVFTYLPVLLFSGIISGLITGFAIYFLFKSHPRFIKFFQL